MRFGIILNGGGRPGDSRTKALADRLEKAGRAQKLGFHSLWVGQGYLNNSLEAALLLSRVAAEAPGLDLGMVVLLPLQHPVQLAEQISTLDVISGGRFTLAAALGWRDFEFRAFGMPKEERLSRFKEVLSTMKMLWTNERVTHRGHYFQIEDVPGAGQPVQQPFPRILIAANLDPWIVRAARTADGWLVSSRSTLGAIKRGSELYHETIDQVGRGGHVLAWREMYVAQDRDTAIETIRPYAEWLYKERAALGHNVDLPEEDRIDMPFDQVLEGRFIIGSPDECAVEIEKYQQLGVEEIIMRCQWPGMPVESAFSAMELFAKEVLPRFT